MRIRCLKQRRRKSKKNLVSGLMLRFRRETIMFGKLTGKPHWPLTTYEKVWGFWHLAGIRLLLGIGLIFSPLLFLEFFPLKGPLSASPPLALIFLMFLLGGAVSIIAGFIGIVVWWQ